LYNAFNNSVKIYIFEF